MGRRITCSIEIPLPAVSHFYVRDRICRLPRMPFGTWWFSHLVASNFFAYRRLAISLILALTSASADFVRFK
jgi:hypothetical protein